MATGKDLKTRAQRLFFNEGEFSSEALAQELDNIYKEINRIQDISISNLIFKEKEINSNYEVSPSDQVIECRTAGITVYLFPSDRAIRDGQVLIIKDASGGAAGSNITISSRGQDDIDGNATITLNSNYEVSRLYLDKQRKRWNLW